MARNNAGDDTYNLLVDSDDIADDEISGYEPNLIYVLNAILSGTARLNVLLPTATILAFTIFTPLLTDDGRCAAAINRYLTAAFILLCALSCVFFTLTDSFNSTADGGRLYYGMATLKGIWTFDCGGHRRRKKVSPAAEAEYKLRWSDLFHSMLSVVAFAAFAGSHNDVVGCYYPAAPKKVTNVVPLVVGFVVSVLFVMFPTRRRGVGYPFLLHREAFYYRR